MQALFPACLWVHVSLIRVRLQDGKHHMMHTMLKKWQRSDAHVLWSEKITETEEVTISTLPALSPCRSLSLFFCSAWARCIMGAEESDDRKHFVRCPQLTFHILLWNPQTDGAEHITSFFPWLLKRHSHSCWVSFLNAVRYCYFKIPLWHSSAGLSLDVLACCGLARAGLLHQSQEAMMVRKPINDWLRGHVVHENIRHN